MEPLRPLRQALAGDSAGGALAELPEPLAIEAVLSYAESAPVEVAEHLATFVRAHSPVPLGADGAAADAAADPNGADAAGAEAHRAVSGLDHAVALLADAPTGPWPHPSLLMDLDGDPAQLTPHDATGPAFGFGHGDTPSGIAQDHMASPSDWHFGGGHLAGDDGVHGAVHVEGAFAGMDDDVTGAPLDHEFEHAGGHTGDHFNDHSVDHSVDHLIDRGAEHSLDSEWPQADTHHSDPQPLDPHHGG